MSESAIYGFRHLQEILQSRSFERATVLRRLLLYLWENKDKDINEYAIAVEVLHRDEDFESKIDATVRVQIWRLRRLLAKYYLDEGKNCAIHLTIPLGTHRIQLVEGQSASVENISAEEIPAVEYGSFSGSNDHSSASVPRHNHLSVPALYATLVIFGLCLSILLIALLYRSPRVVASARKDPPAFWKSFIDNGKPVRIILPTPLFFEWFPNGKGSFLLVRDLSVNDFSRVNDSSQLKNLSDRLGKPRSAQIYTSASDTFASVQLARFLDRYSIDCSLSASVESPKEIEDQEDIIAFGTDVSLAAYRPDLSRLKYKLAPESEYVTDLDDLGRGKQFPIIRESPSRTIFPGVVAALPQSNSTGRILIVEGTHTSALISFLTSDIGLAELAKALETHHTRYFEAVVLSEVGEGHTIQSRLVAFKSIPSQEAVAKK